MTLSLRAGLAAIGEPEPHGRAYRHGFAACPASLADGIRAMIANPRMADWVRVEPEASVDAYWSEEAQGITWDGKRFVTSSNGSAGQWYPGASPKAIYCFKPGQYRFLDDDIETRIELPLDNGDHLGDIDYFGGWLYCAVEPETGPLPVVLKVDLTGTWGPRLMVTHGAALSGQGNSFPWCAVN